MLWKLTLINVTATVKTRCRNVDMFKKSCTQHFRFIQQGFQACVLISAELSFKFTPKSSCLLLFAWKKKSLNSQRPEKRTQSGVSLHLIQFRTLNFRNCKHDGVHMLFWAPSGLTHIKVVRDTPHVCSGFWKLRVSSDTKYYDCAQNF